MAADIARVGRDLLTLKKHALNQVHGRLGFEDAVRAARRGTRWRTAPGPSPRYTTSVNGTA